MPKKKKKKSSEAAVTRPRSLSELGFMVQTLTATKLVGVPVEAARESMANAINEGTHSVLATLMFQAQQQNLLLHQTPHITMVPLGRTKTELQLSVTGVALAWRHLTAHDRAKQGEVDGLPAAIDDLLSKVSNQGGAISIEGDNESQSDSKVAASFGT